MKIVKAVGKKFLLWCLHALMAGVRSGRHGPFVLGSYLTLIGVVVLALQFTFSVDATSIIEFSA